MAPTIKRSLNKSGDTFKNGFGINIISHKQLFGNSEAYFITDRRLRFAAKIYLHEDPAERTSLFTENWKSLYESMKHSDVIIKSSDSKEIKAHKLVLAARSEFFDRMFSSDMKENTTGVIEINKRSGVIKELLRFIYCEAYFNEFDASFDINDIEIYDDAECYQMDDLKKFCLKSIYKRLDAENVLEIASFAQLFKIEKLYSYCLLLIHA